VKIKASLHKPFELFLTYAFSILIRVFLLKNATHSIAFLPWFEEMNLGLAQIVCK